MKNRQKCAVLNSQPNRNSVQSSSDPKWGTLKENNMKTHKTGSALLKSMEFTTLIPISRNAIPLGRGRGHGQSLEDMQVVKDVTSLLAHVKEAGVSPHEIAQEIDTNTIEIRTQKAQRKSFTQSFRSLLKEKVKEYGLDGQIDIREFNKGERFFLVGRAA